MLDIDYRKLDPITRRRMLSSAAKTCFGLSVVPLLDQTLQAQSATRGVKNVIYLMMNGAMSHIDTFDPKPGNPVQGETGVISTKIPGVQFGEHFSNLAQTSDKIAVIRSMSTSTGAHGPGRYLMRTSYRPLATTRHPGIGPWMQKIAGKKKRTLPSTVNIGGGAGPGYLGAQFAPVPIGDPNKGLENTKSPKYVTEELFDRRMELSRKFDRAFQKKATKAAVTGYDDLYKDTIGLLKSEDLKAFDINQESEDVRNKYGNDRLGRGCLLARRLLENGVRFVEVESGGWDMHQNIFESIPNRAGQLDNAVSTLITDLEERGMLNDTLVVISSEFGRKPRINQNSGRDHHPAAFSTMLAGAGVKAGQAFGKTDEEAFYVDEDSVSVEDFNATIGAIIGIPPAEEIYSPDGRPFTLGNGGTPVAKLI